MTPSPKIIISFILLLCSCRSNGKSSEQANSTIKQKNTPHGVYTPPVIDSELLNVWNNFTRIVTSRNYDEFKKISLEKIVACHDTLDVSNFSNKCFLDVFDT